MTSDNQLSPHDELESILVSEYYTQEEFDNLLDSFAMETIRKVAVSMRRAWKANHFPVHETDGVAGAMEYLIDLISDKGEIRTGVVGRDFMAWLTDSSDA